METRKMYPMEKYQFKVYEKTNEDGSKSSVVVALSTYCGKVVKGVSKCMESDPFDLEKGTKLAAARCDYKVCEKRCKRAKKKYVEAVKKLKDLEDYTRKMGNYYSDANYECTKSKLRLKVIEEELM
jgi:hypothetical protein